MGQFVWFACSPARKVRKFLSSHMSGSILQANMKEELNSECVLNFSQSAFSILPSNSWWPCIQAGIERDWSGLAWFHSTYENFRNSNRNFWSNGTCPTLLVRPNPNSAVLQHTSSFGWRLIPWRCGHAKATVSFFVLKFNIILVCRQLVVAP